MTHYAALWMFGNYYTSHKPNITQLVLIITTGVLALIGIAYFIMVGYDLPVRKYLSIKRNGRIAEK
jgi:hypothetical protein